MKELGGKCLYCGNGLLIWRDGKWYNLNGDPYLGKPQSDMWFKGDVHFSGNGGSLNTFDDTE